VAEPGPRGAEATLGATASPLGQPSANRGQPVKARLPPKRFLTLKKIKIPYACILFFIFRVWEIGQTKKVLLVLA
jgi:hypothetical protein